MSQIIKHDQELMKKINKEMILNLIREKGPISRADLAKITNMSPTSISRIVTDFSELGLVKETNLTSSGVGRKAILLDTDPNSIHVISVEMDQSISKIGVVDFDGNIILKEEVTYDSHVMDWEKVVDKICNTIGGIIEQENSTESKIIGIGIGIPGIVDDKSGRVVFSPQLGWKDVGIVDYIEKRFGYKTTIDNLIKSKAIAENVYGSTKGSKRAALINFGTGVGSALIVNEEIYRGITNSAGEIGHTTIDPNGRLCDCGRIGCLQTFITEEALIQEARAFKNVYSIKEIFDSEIAGENWAINLIDRLYTYVGIAVCNVICMYNPDTVIITGKLIEERPEILDVIMKRVDDRIWAPFKNTYEIKGSNLCEKSGMLGVASLVINKYLDAEL
ncbi:MAG: ROK family transcriptional regulator [Tissierella sp.]|nr:ROK family transcriptional regulator [Tissierella sp.]